MEETDQFAFIRHMFDMCLNQVETSERPLPVLSRVDEIAFDLLEATVKTLGLESPIEAPGYIVSVIESYILERESISILGKLWCYKLLETLTMFAKYESKYGR